MARKAIARRSAAIVKTYPSARAGRLRPVHAIGVVLCPARSQPQAAGGTVPGAGYHVSGREGAVAARPRKQDARLGVFWLLKDPPLEETRIAVGAAAPRARRSGAPRPVHHSQPLRRREDAGRHPEPHQRCRLDHLTLRHEQKGRFGCSAQPLRSDRRAYTRIFTFRPDSGIAFPMSSLLQAGLNLSACCHAQADGQAPVLLEKRFLISPTTPGRPGRSMPGRDSPEGAVR